MIRSRTEPTTRTQMLVDDSKICKMSLESTSEHLFGFNDAQFSDRVLVLVEEDEQNPQESDRVHVSSMLLCARSEYFRKLFGKSFAENASKEVELLLASGEKDVVLDILKFVYSMMCNSKLQSEFLKDKSTDHIVRLSVVADRYMFPDAVEAGIHLLMNRDLSVAQCGVLCKVMETLSYQNLKAKIVTVMDKVFEDYESKLDDPALTDLGSELFRIMISSDTLNIYSENSIWAAIVCWSKKNKPSDEVLISLLECVRLEYIDVGYLMNFVAPSPYWRYSGALPKLLGMALARGELSDKFMAEYYDRPKRRNRSVKNSSSIMIKWEVKLEEVRDMAKGECAGGPVSWVSGMPFRAVAKIVQDDSSETFRLGLETSCDTSLHVEDFIVGVNINMFIKGNTRAIIPWTSPCFSRRSLRWFSGRKYKASPNELSVSVRIWNFDFSY
eukprot:209883_1